MGTEHGAVTAGVPIFPAANELTRSVNVTPGCHFDALLDVSFQLKNVVFDLGYNLYWREAESVSVCTWEDDTFGILRKTIDTSAQVDRADHFIDGKFVNRDNLDVAVAETPDQLSHKLFVGAMYRTIFGGCPLNVGVGGSYELASNNAALDQYAVWLKGGLVW